MAWFTEDTLDFFRELELNNNREWFTANKQRYENSVRKPMERFAGEMIERMKAIEPGITMEPKDAVFRIYRDIRFSKDKTPYKTNAGLSITSGGRREFSKPGIYFHIDPRTCGVASGFYSLEPNDIKAIRGHIVANPDRFAKLAADRAFVEAFGDVRGEKNKVLPAEYKEAAASLPVLYNKQFYYWNENEAEAALRDDLGDFLMSRYRAAIPMNEFLAEAFDR